jgi:hypothetical protein
MLKECDNLIGQARGVVDGEIVTVDDEKFGHHNKRTALILLLECVRQGNNGKQSNGERYQVLLTIRECVLRVLDYGIQVF